MDDSRSEMWKEIKEGVVLVVKIMMYGIVGLGALFGAGYIYVTCFQ